MVAGRDRKIAVTRGPRSKVSRPRWSSRCTGRPVTRPSIALRRKSQVRRALVEFRRWFEALLAVPARQARLDGRGRSGRDLLGGKRFGPRSRLTGIEGKSIGSHQRSSVRRESRLRRANRRSGRREIRLWRAGFSESCPMRPSVPRWTRDLPGQNRETSGSPSLFRRTR